MGMSNRSRASPNAPGGNMGEVFDDLRAKQHISERQHLAGMLFLRDLGAAHGSSEGLVGQTAERVQTGSRARIYPPGGISTADMHTLDNHLRRLRPHERRLMKHLTLQREVARGSLADLGRQLSGYQTAKTRQAYAVGRIGAFLDTLAETYLGPQESV